MRDHTLKGLCVGHMVTSREESAEAVSVFYDALARRLPAGTNFCPDYVVADDFAPFAAEFGKSFGCPSPKHLMCLWHIHKNWFYSIILFCVTRW